MLRILVINQTLSLTPSFYLCSPFPLSQSMFAVAIAQLQNDHSLYMQCTYSLLFRGRLKRTRVCLWPVHHPCLSRKRLCRGLGDSNWVAGGHRTQEPHPSITSLSAPPLGSTALYPAHNRGQRGRHTEGRSRIQGTQPSSPNSSDVSTAFAVPPQTKK